MANELVNFQLSTIRAKFCVIHLVPFIKNMLIHSCWFAQETNKNRDYFEFIYCILSLGALDKSVSTTCPQGKYAITLINLLYNLIDSSQHLT